MTFIGSGCCCAAQVHGRAVAGIEIIDVVIVLIDNRLTVNVQRLLTYDTHFTATANLEGITVVQVHLGAAPYLGVLTITATKYNQSHGVQIITLVEQFHSRLLSTKECALSCTEDLITYQHVIVDINSDVTVHMSTVVAASIDVTA